MLNRPQNLQRHKAAEGWGDLYPVQIMHGFVGGPVYSEAGLVSGNRGLCSQEAWPLIRLMHPPDPSIRPTVGLDPGRGFAKTNKAIF